MKTATRLICVLLAVFASLAAPQDTAAQNGMSPFRAIDFQYSRIFITAGTTATGAGTLTLGQGSAVTNGGLAILPFASDAYGNFSPMKVNDGANTETVTPTASSGCRINAPAGVNCLVTATFTYTHSSYAYITSGTFGLQEALAYANTQGGGIVKIDAAWAAAGGTNTILTAANPLPLVGIEDNRTGLQYWTVKPSVLTALATPATRSATAGATQVIDGTAVGTFANAALYVCVTYVDMLGGESPCSASFNYTPAGSLATNWASPAASTGAVGWRAYAGITGTSTQYQLPITSSNCTLSTLAGVNVACAIGASAVFTTPSTTTMLAPGQVTAVYRPNTQSHTTFAYAPTGAVPVLGFQTDYGPFLATVGGTTTQVQVLGTVPFPSATLNTIYRTLEVSGHITMTAGTSETPVLKLQLGPTWTTGTPTDICIFKNTTALSAAVYSLNFTCTITTNATGTSGTLMPDGMAVVALGAGTTAGTAMPELGTAAITASLTGVNNLFITYIPTSGTDTAVQLLDLHLRLK